MSQTTITSMPVMPRWARELQRLLPIRSQFVFAGNIRDSFLLPEGDSQGVMPLVSGLWSTLKNMGYSGLIVYDRVDGLRVVPNDAETCKQVETLLKITLSSGKLETPYNNLKTYIRAVTEASSKDGSPAPRMAFVVDYASRITVHDNELTEAEHEFFIACEKFSDTATQLAWPDQPGVLFFNPLIWLVNKLEDMPSWYLIGNERIHALMVERPDYDTRKLAAQTLLKSFASSEAAQPATVDNKAVELFTNLTEGMTIRSMVAISRLAKSQRIALSAFGDAVRLYKVGLPDNPWKKQGVREKIAQAPEILGQRVKGQPQAIQKTADILMRSVEGLTGAHSASATSSRPRGVLFFAGPTGVGKTELAKALTEMIFGDDRAYIRFDMSEFSAEHADQRLIGAPPSYEGYSAGGELTNAIREKPFSVVLFDEIEKAHPKILDKFLQILEDGRLTDGRGETVYFSEAVIIFTSNLGISTRDAHGKWTKNPEVTPNKSHEDLSVAIKNGIQHYFNYELNRPELLNRFGDNFVVFNFISKDIAKQILAGMLSNVCNRVKTERGLILNLSHLAKQHLEEHCLADLTHGGRGIANKLESVFVNPLARALFSRPISDTALTVRCISQDAATGIFTVEFSA